MSQNEYQGWLELEDHHVVTGLQQLQQQQQLGRGWLQLEPHERVTQVSRHDLASPPGPDEDSDEDDGEDEDDDGQQDPDPGRGGGLRGLGTWF